MGKYPALHTIYIEKLEKENARLKRACKRLLDGVLWQYGKDGCKAIGDNKLRRAAKNAEKVLKDETTI